MDLYKKKLYKHIGIGGLNCPCCNPSRSKHGSLKLSKDNSLNNIARKNLKIDDSNIFKEEIIHREDTNLNDLGNIMK